MSYHRPIPSPLPQSSLSFPTLSCSSVGWGPQVPSPGLFRVEEPSYYQFPSLTVLACLQQTALRPSSSEE